MKKGSEGRDKLREDFRARIAAIDPETRKELGRMYYECTGPREDGGMNLSLDDYLWHAFDRAMSDDPARHTEELAAVTVLPPAFFCRLQQALGFPAPLSEEECAQAWHDIQAAEAEFEASFADSLKSNQAKGGRT